MLERARANLLIVGNPWFPSPKELREWQESEQALYARITGKSSLEVGPRTASLWAACFSPVIRLSLHEQGDTTVLEPSAGLNPTTLWLLLGWSLTLVAWGTVLLPALYSGDEHWSWAIWWVLLVAATISAPIVGRVAASAQLEHAALGLRTQLEEDLGEDW